MLCDTFQNNDNGYTRGFMVLRIYRSGCFAADLEAVTLNAVNEDHNYIDAANDLCKIQKAIARQTNVSIAPCSKKTST